MFCVWLFEVWFLREIDWCSGNLNVWSFVRKDERRLLGKVNF